MGTYNLNLFNFFTNFSKMSDFIKNFNKCIDEMNTIPFSIGLDVDNCVSPSEVVNYNWEEYERFYHNYNN